MFRKNSHLYIERQVSERCFRILDIKLLQFDDKGESRQIEIENADMEREEV